MNLHHSLLLVEGQQDVFFLGRILKELGLTAIRNIDELPEFWSVFRHESKLRLHRAEVARGRNGLPIHELSSVVCFTGTNHSIAIRKVNGNLKKFRRLILDVDLMLDGGLRSCQSIGVLPDADQKPSAATQSAIAAFNEIDLPAPHGDETLVRGNPNVGVFPFPGNNQTGGLEELLLDCAQAVYPTLYSNANSYISSINLSDDALTANDIREMKTPQGPKKAVVGSIASVLKPGATVQVSVLRDRWVSEESLKVPSVKLLVSFLKNLCEL